MIRDSRYEERGRRRRRRRRERGRVTPLTGAEREAREGLRLP
jgi:hypothetical protein